MEQLIKECESWLKETEEMVRPVLEAKEIAEKLETFNQGELKL